MTSTTPRPRVPFRPPHLRTLGRQRGIVMAITLISLALLLVGAAAMLRTVDTSGMLAGNLAFRRDLANRSESAIVAAREALTNGALNTEAARSADLAKANYSATKLASSSGVPTVLADESAYAKAGYASLAADKVTLYWVVDRQCVSGTVAFSTAACEFVSSDGDAGGSSWLRKPNGASRPVYRISVRVKGPRDSEAYFQSTFVD